MAMYGFKKLAIIEAFIAKDEDVLHNNLGNIVELTEYFKRVVEDGKHSSTLHNVFLHQRIQQAKQTLNWIDDLVLKLDDGMQITLTLLGYKPYEWN